MIKYINVEWPEYQIFEEHDRIEECYTVKVYGDDDIQSLMVPEDLYWEIIRKKEFPKTYKTDLGTIICYEDKAIVNDIDTYVYYPDKINRGEKALIYIHENKTWTTSKIVTCSEGLPILFENKDLLPGINCEIIGIKK